MRVGDVLAGAGAMVCCALLVACGGDDPPASVVTTPVASGSSTSAAPVVVTSPARVTSSTSLGPGAPGVPAVARVKSDAGAFAFARHYIELVNEVGQRPKVGVLEPLALDSCKTCALYEQTARSNLQKGYHFDGPAFRILRIYREARPGKVIVGVVAQQPEGNLRDADGATVQNYPAQATQAEVFDLAWTSGGWRVNTIKYDRDVTS